VPKLPAYLQGAWFPRVLPFFIYMAFIALEGFVGYMAGLFPVLAPVAEFDHYFFYPLKIVLISVVLILLWRSYSELNDRPSAKEILLSIAAGVVVFVLWINMDWSFATAGGGEGFNPYLHVSGTSAIALIAIRILGASVIVPIFEELFWRSFIIRYIIDHDFIKIPIGAFTWASFIVTSIFFGIEHHMWLAGIVAGAAYTLLLYRTKKLICPIVSHGVTNLLLGLYVLQTGNWHFW
jgi:CAAX prenyl protease-like protein